MRIGCAHGDEAVALQLIDDLLGKPVRDLAADGHFFFGTRRAGAGLLDLGLDPLVERHFIGRDGQVVNDDHLRFGKRTGVVGGGGHLRWATADQ